MKSVNRIGSILLVLVLLTAPSAFAQKVRFADNWGPDGYSLTKETSNQVEVNFSISHLEISDINIRGEAFNKIALPGHFMFNVEGAPDLPGDSRYILVPEDAVPELQIIDYRVETLQNINLIPAPKIPMDIDDQPMTYEKDASIYNQDAFYPSSPVTMYPGKKIRGMSVVKLGIVPFQYNPVTRELKVYSDIRVRITFQGGSGLFGVEKYRSRWWDPIVEDLVMNSASLPGIDYNKRYTAGNRTFNGCEYLIICPNGAAFQQWADSIKQFRTEQGILTEIRTVSEVGGNTSAAIESYVDNAYNTWDIPPSAVLLLGDHGTDPQSSITSVILNNHPSGYNPYVSDNVYADVDGDYLPDIAFARITARNATELELMVHKFMNYERTPPTDPNFYDHPITALGWQTERWFQICSEAVGGFFKNELGKNPVRINAVYGGDPSVDPWSTASNTTAVVNYFGPSGQGYIPNSPSELGGWTGGNATQINNAINNGSFLLQHRDHGAYWGWGEPYYSTSNIGGLTNTDLTFIMSINCQTGKFEYSTEVFTERFHRYSYGGNPSGALGLIAATEVSYSFVNDVYVWGLYDYMWPDFLPDNASNPTPRGLMPGFGNVAGKYYLHQCTWTSGYSSLYEITDNLFHLHGDAFLEICSEVPQDLTVAHAGSILSSQTSFSVTANQGALVALSCGGEILGTATATGNSQDIDITGGSLIAGGDLVVTITLTNHNRYRAEVPILPPSGPFVTCSQAVVNDACGNNNGQLDCGESSYLAVALQNIGTSQTNSLTAVISTPDTLVQIVDSSAVFGNILPGDTIATTNDYHLIVSDYLPDNHEINFQIEASNGDSSWTDFFSITGHTPILSMVDYALDDSGGNGNGLFDTGETVLISISVENSGSALASNCLASMTTNDPYLQITSPNVPFGHISTGGVSTHAFELSSDPGTPPAHVVQVYLSFLSDNSLAVTDSLEFYVGKVPALVLDLDDDATSGPAIAAAMEANGVFSSYATSFPDDLAQYQSIFCSLGIYPHNHVLSPAEGQLLADYLDAGGQLYMEGGDTWAYDQPTAVHPLFNITGTSDGASDLSTLAGLSGTFADSLTFSYSGQNSYIDRLAAVSPAYTVLQNTAPAYNTAIAYDQGNYKTIGSSHEFGGISESNNTKAQLIARYLQFFGIAVTCEWNGNTSNWNDPGSWTNGLVPNSSTDVSIPSVIGGVYPIQFPTGTAHCKSLKVDPGAIFNLPAGVVLTIHQ